MWKKIIKVIDWQTKKSYNLPRFGKYSWIKWLICEGYALVDEVQIGDNTINLYRNENNIYAIYNPDIINVDLELECLLINILSEDNARVLISDIKEKLSLLI